MPIPWGDHLDMARCVEVLGEYDLREATTAMGRCLFHLQRDLLLETWREQLLTKQLMPLKSLLVRARRRSFNGVFVDERSVAACDHANANAGRHAAGAVGS